MEEEKKQRLMKLLKKYPNYEIIFDVKYFMVRMYGQTYFTYDWEKRILRTQHTANQQLFNEIMEIVENQI